MVDTYNLGLKRSGKTVESIIELISQNKNELVDKGKLLYLAVLTSDKSIKEHMKALNHLVHINFIVSYKSKHYKGNSWYITVYV